MGPCAFTCIQGAPLVVIKLSRMTDLPGFRGLHDAAGVCTTVGLARGRRVLAATLRERARSLENWFAYLHRCARARGRANACVHSCVCARSRQVAIMKSEIQRASVRRSNLRFCGAARDECTYVRWWYTYVRNIRSAIFPIALRSIPASLGNYTAAVLLSDAFACDESHDS